MIEYLCFSHLAGFAPAELGGMPSRACLALDGAGGLFAVTETMTGPSRLPGQCPGAAIEAP